MSESEKSGTGSERSITIELQENRFEELDHIVQKTEWNNRDELVSELILIFLNTYGSSFGNSSTNAQKVEERLTDLGYLE